MPFERLAFSLEPDQVARLSAIAARPLCAVGDDGAGDLDRAARARRIDRRRHA